MESVPVFPASSVSELSSLHVVLPKRCYPSTGLFRAMSTQERKQVRAVFTFDSISTQIICLSSSLKVLMDYGPDCEMFAFGIGRLNAVILS